jgi:hypothetical protein
LASTVSPCVLVYDVGGSHISCAVCFANDYRLGPIAKANLPETQTSDAFVSVLHSLRQQATGEHSPIGAELAMPGPSTTCRASVACATSSPISTA